jgi:putative N-acetylmannosamine-6-phosphate epimerase
MNNLLHRLQTEEFTLMVSLPRNDVRLAQAALEGGAQSLKVHLNVEHFASGTRFGSFDEERENIARIVDAAGSVPVGIVPGGTPFATEEEFSALAEIGVDFFDAYPADAPPWTLTQRHLGRMLAAFEGATAEIMMTLEEAGMEMCEASIMNHTEYGRDLTVLDVARYRELANCLDGPVIVPSQKRVVPRDVEALRQAGVKGLLIGAIVTGREAESVQSATRSFREALRNASTV